MIRSTFTNSINRPNNQQCSTNNLPASHQKYIDYHTQIINCNSSPEKINNNAAKINKTTSDIINKKTLSINKRNSRTTKKKYSTATHMCLGKTINGAYLNDTNKNTEKKSKSTTYPRTNLYFQLSCTITSKTSFQLYQNKVQS